MSHDYHEALEPRPILFDGCAECDARARTGVDALLNLDADNFRSLLEQVLEIEFRDRGAYRSTNDSLIGTALYRVLVILEWHLELTRHMVTRI